MKKKDTFVKVIAVLFVLFWFLLRKAPDALPGVAVIVIFLSFWVAVVVFAIIQGYKKPSEEEKKAQEQDRQKRPTVRGSLTGLAGLAIVAVIMTQKGVGKGFYIFFAVTALIFLVQLFLALRDKNTREGEQAPSERAYTAAEKIIPIIFSVFGIGFCVAWCWIAISHGVWFVAPLGILMGIAMAAPLIKTIAGRIRSGREEDPTFSDKEEEPWDKDVF